MPSQQTTITNHIAKLTQAFVGQLVSVVEQSFTARVLAGLKPGKGGSVLAPLRRAAPKQLCPVPGCKNAAAPVFGMVCAKHKDLPKSKVKAHREARRKRVAAAKKTGHA